MLSSESEDDNLWENLVMIKIRLIYRKHLLMKKNIRMINLLLNTSQLIVSIIVHNFDQPEHY